MSIHFDKKHGWSRAVGLSNGECHLNFGVAKEERGLNSFRGFFENYSAPGFLTPSRFEKGKLQAAISEIEGRFSRQINSCILSG
jgi:hypothetical protein